MYWSLISCEMEPEERFRPMPLRIGKLALMSVSSLSSYIHTSWWLLFCNYYNSPLFFCLLIGFKWLRLIITGSLFLLAMQVIYSEAQGNSETMHRGILPNALCTALAMLQL